MAPLGRQHSLPLDLICQEDVLDSDVVDFFLQHREQDPGCDLDTLQRHVADIQAGANPPVDVYLEGMVYRVLVDFRELASAYRYNGRKEIPVNILPPDDPAIPTYVRNDTSITHSGPEAWN